MDDIKKMGYLRKVKTNKKKFFVLRGESDRGPARLEYYDSEKKFRSGAQPKRVINLKTCFDINRKLDTKNKWVIALYTKDDCFSISLDSEEEMEDWLMTMLELQHDDEGLGAHEKPKPNYEHVWEVNVKGRTMGSCRVPLGPYRLCLNDRTLTLVQLNSNEPLIFEYPMVSIRRFGHSEAFFYMEVGRATATGAGEIWMQTEDTLIAQSVHEAVLNAMDSNKDDLSPWQRGRSQSANDSSKPALCHSRRQTLNVVPSHAACCRERCDSMPSRPRTISDGHSEAGPSSRHSYDLRCHRSMYNRTMSCSPPFAGASGSSDNTSGSFLSTSDGSVNHSDISHIKDSPLEPSIEEESGAYASMSYNECTACEQEGYMEMQPCRSMGYSPTSPYSGRSSQISHSDRASVVSPPSWLPVHNMSPSSIPYSGDYLEMSSPGSNTNTAATPDGYMSMSPIGSLLANEVKEKANDCQNKSDQNVEGYVPMAPLGGNFNQTLQNLSPSCDSYMDMAPLSHSLARGNNLEATVDLSSRRSSDSPSTDMCFAEYPLDKVQAYFTPNEEEEPIVRTCSIGSRNDCKVKNNRLDVTSESCRIRAFSVGSNVKKGVGFGSKFGHGAMRGKGMPFKCIPVNSECSVGAETVNGGGSSGGKKSLSAPVLGTSPINNVWQTNGISHSKKQNNNGDLMEMDFPGSQSSSDHRKISSSLSGRPRTNSKSSHIRHSKIDSTNQSQSVVQKKLPPEQSMKASDYLVMQATCRGLSVPAVDNSGSGERKCSLPIAISESSSTKEKRRSSDIDIAANSDGEYVNIDPSRSFEYRPTISTTTTLNSLLGVNSFTHRPPNSSNMKFNPEYVNLQYGLQSTKIGIEEEKEVSKKKQSPTTNETESDYTLMAPGYPKIENGHKKLPSPQSSKNGDVTVKCKTSQASISEGDVKEEEAERELNYADLDLPPTSIIPYDENDNNNMSAKSISSQVYPATTNSLEEVAAFSNTSSAASLYAKIDFVKSEGLRSQPQNAIN